MKHIVHRYLRHTQLFLTLVWVAYWCALNNASVQDLVIPTTISNSLERGQIPLDAVSISVSEIEPGKQGKHTAKPILDWRASEAMNPASTMKILATLAGLDILGPQYRWRTRIFTNGTIRLGILKGDLYLQGSGDPKLIPEELAKLMKDLQALGIQKIDGNLFFDRSAYAPSVMEHNTIDVH
jgi:D-alanyl-D-alanine carboxypeptidase/D-alanyl-D-alanine-endopeptidase (penicillin-binding protein 4)